MHTHTQEPFLSHTQSLSYTHTRAPRPRTRSPAPPRPAPVAWQQGPRPPGVGGGGHRLEDPPGRRSPLPASAARRPGAYLPKVDIAEAAAAVGPRHRAAHWLGSGPPSPLGRATSRGPPPGPRGRRLIPQSCPVVPGSCAARGAFPVTPSSLGLLGNVVPRPREARLSWSSPGHLEEPRATSPRVVRAVTASSEVALP